MSQPRTLKRLSIITGFLGSGKTTLLNRLLEDPSMSKTAVLVNELGSVGIDHLIVDQFDDDIVLLESGCVCCSIRDDLTASLLNLHSRSERGDMPPFDQAVLETTGIANPATILQLLMSDSLVCERYRFGTVTTVVDACFGENNIDCLPEARSQLLLADRIALSKTDLVDAGRVATVRSKVQDLNPIAPLLLSSSATPAQLFADVATHEFQAVATGTTHRERFDTYQVTWKSPAEQQAIELWIEGLLSARGDDIWRIKGLMSIRNRQRPVVFQSVQHSVYELSTLAEWPDGDPRTDLTFIVQHFPKEAALASLRPFVELDDDEK